MTTKAAILASLCLVSVGCTRRPAPEPVAPTTPPPTTTTTSPEPIAPTPPSPPSTSPAPAIPPREGPVDLTPVQLASYSTGSSCNLVHDGEHLYWLTQTMAEETGEKRSARARRTGACGASLDCSRTRGAVMRVADTGGPEEVVARTTEWPWRLAGDATSLFWIGYCSSALWTVAKSGGTPKKLGPKDLQIVDHVVEAGRVVVADRFGSKSSRGIYAIDRARGTATPLAARGGAPWLIGTLGARVFWATTTGETFMVYAAGSPGGDAYVGDIRGMPMEAWPADGGLVVRTSQAIVRIAEKGPMVDLVTLSHYEDRGSLGIGAGWVYWANGRAGTLARLGPDGARREVEVGGEPCGVAVDEAHVYWLDRGRRAVMRAPLALFADDAGAGR